RKTLALSTAVRLTITATARAMGGSSITKIGILTRPSRRISEIAPMNTTQTMHQPATSSDQTSDRLSTKRQNACALITAMIATSSDWVSLCDTRSIKSNRRSIAKPSRLTMSGASAQRQHGLHDVAIDTFAGSVPDRLAELAPPFHLRGGGLVDLHAGVAQFPLVGLLGGLVDGVGLIGRFLRRRGERRLHIGPKRVPRCLVHDLQLHGEDRLHVAAVLQHLMHAETVGPDWLHVNAVDDAVGQRIVGLGERHRRRIAAPAADQFEFER